MPLTGFLETIRSRVREMLTAKALTVAELYNTRSYCDAARKDDAKYIARVMGVALADAQEVWLTIWSRNPEEYAGLLRAVRAAADWEDVGDPAKGDLLFRKRDRDVSMSFATGEDATITIIATVRDREEKLDQQLFLRRVDFMWDNLMALGMLAQSLPTEPATEEPSAEEPPAELTADGPTEILPAGSTGTQYVGPYEIMDEIGRGGMGVVHRARHRESGLVAALKVLQGSFARPNSVTRFEREAEVLRGMDHPNIVGFHGIGYDPNRDIHFCAMEYISGEDLRKRIARLGTLSEAEAVSVTTQVAAALEHADSSGIVHRDIKPGNVIIADDGTVKVLDFGLARATDVDVTRVTESGQFVGTANYASPEQARGEHDLDVRSDIYALGCTMYHMLTGAAPFEGSTTYRILLSQIDGRLPWPADVVPGLTDGICCIIAKMMARDPALRYQRPGELMRDLAAHAEGELAEVEAEALAASTIARTGAGDPQP